jgi:hypothetical protein
MAVRTLSNQARRTLGVGLVTLGLSGALVGVVWPCTCPGHRGGGAAGVGVVADRSMAGMGDGEMAGMSDGEMARMHGAAPASTTAAGSVAGDGPDAAGTTDGAGGSSNLHPLPGMPGMKYKVGTATHPVVADGPDGPLWKATGSRSAAAREGVARATAAAIASRAAGAGGDRGELATRTAVLTTAQATKQLTAKCRRLVKAKKPSKLSKKDRKRRTACLKTRAKLIAQSKPGPAQPPTGPIAPAAPIVGPVPVGTVPAPTTPAPTSPTPETPAGPVYAAAGVKAIDGGVPFALTRSTAVADIVNFELVNTDAQNHNLWIQVRDQPATKKAIIASLAPGQRANANVQLAPGEYQLICIVPGHGAMTMLFTVVAPS